MTAKITKSAKASEIKRQWWVVDAADKVLGRTATEIARILRGKHKPIYTPHVDTGDFVIVINCEKVRVTGKKETDKIYHHHTGWVGSVVSETLEKRRARRPELIIKDAVSGMLPKNTLGRNMFKKLKVYAGSAHPHASQKPETLEL